MCCNKVVSSFSKELFAHQIKGWKVIFDGTILCPICAEKDNSPFDKKPLEKFLNRCKTGKGYFVSCGEE